MLPNQINTFLGKVSSDLRGVLADNLLSVYVWGSVATGGFKEGLSDIDLVVVTKISITDKELLSLEVWTQELLAKEPLAEVLDAVFIEQSALNFGDGSSSKGGIEFWKGKINRTKNSLGDNPIVLDNIINGGMVVYGPHPSEIINPITRDKIINAINKELVELKMGVEAHFNDLKWRYYCVSTLCRMLFNIKNKSYSSKEGALKWYLENNMSREDLINSALLYSTEGNIESIQNTKKQDYLDFIDEVSKEVI